MESLDSAGSEGPCCEFLLAGSQGAAKVPASRRMNAESSRFRWHVLVAPLVSLFAKGKCGLLLVESLKIDPKR